jgi:hypothetical protein
MSDISFSFPIWVIVAFLLAYALPVTTIILAVLVFAWLAGNRRGTPRGTRSVALDIAILVIGLLWLIGMGGWVWVAIHWLGDWLD